MGFVYPKFKISQTMRGRILYKVLHREVKHSSTLFWIFQEPFDKNLQSRLVLYILIQRKTIKHNTYPKKKIENIRILKKLHISNGRAIYNIVCVTELRLEINYPCIFCTHVHRILNLISRIELGTFQLSHGSNDWTSHKLGENIHTLLNI